MRLPTRLSAPARAAFILLAMTLASADLAAGQALREVTLQLDNDVFDFRLPADERSDVEYTQGARVRFEFTGAPASLMGVAGLGAGCGSGKRDRECLRTSLEIGQEIYNPNVDSPRALPGQRPYAGWLYVEGGIQHGTESELRGLSVSLGVTGPPSLAEAVQTRFHRRFGFREPLGWDDQLSAEPGLQVRYHEARRLTGDLLGRSVVDLMPFASIAVGNVRTGADLGLRARAGTDLPHPWADGLGRSGPSLYVVGALRGSAVLRNLFLDGSTFRSSPRVEKHFWVGEMEGGLGLRLGQFLGEFALVRRSVEYRTQPTGHTRGTFRFAYVPRPGVPRRPSS